MQLTVFNEAVVILAQDHNPTILHPHFLRSEEIVPQDWEPADRPVCTPPFSMVRYTNGVVFTIESNKFQVAKSPATTDLQQSKLPTYAVAYIQKLPHVRYTAVGINLGAILSVSDPARNLIQQFLREGEWNSKELPLREMSLRLVYSVDDGSLNLSCNQGSVVDSASGSHTTGIVLNANYHFNLPGGKPVQEAVEVLNQFSARCDHFLNVIERIFPEKG